MRNYSATLEIGYDFHYVKSYKKLSRKTDKRTSGFNFQVSNNMYQLETKKNEKHRRQNITLRNPF